MEYYDDDESQGMFSKQDISKSTSFGMNGFLNDSVQEANTQWTKRKRTIVTAEKGNILQDLKHRDREG